MVPLPAGARFPQGELRPPRSPGAGVPGASAGAGLVALLSLASAVALLAPSLALLWHAGAGALLPHPVFWLGMLDLLLALGAWRRGARLRRAVRVRAGLGFGFLGALMWLRADIAALAAAAVAAACLWAATCAVCAASRREFAATATAGLAALVFLAYCLLAS